MLLLVAMGCNFKRIITSHFDPRNPTLLEVTKERFDYGIQRILISFYLSGKKKREVRSFDL
jgi:hypothetical protein